MENEEAQQQVADPSTSAGLGQEQEQEQKPVESQTTSDVGAEASRSEEADNHSEKKHGGDSQYNAFIRMLKKQEEKMANLEGMLSKFSNPSEVSKPEPQPVTQEDLWSNPDPYIDNRIEQKLNKRLAEQHLDQAKEKANEYITSQEDVKTPEDINEIQTLVEQHKINLLIGLVDPIKLADLALGYWRNSRGVVARKNGSSNSSAKMQAGGAQGGAAPSGKKIWSRAEIEAADTPAKWDKVKDDVFAAQQEGRIRD